MNWKRRKVKWEETRSPGSSLKNHCFSYIFNEKTSELLSGAACQLSQKASHCVIEDWFKMMDVRVTALDVINESLKH